MLASVKHLSRVLFFLIASGLGYTAEQCAHLNINSNTHFGAIGIVNANILDEEKARELSSKLATVDLNRLGIDKSEETFYFKKGIYQGAIAVSGDYSLKQCSDMQCDFSSCRPSWLCNASPGNGIISVSYRSTSLKSQFNYLKKNHDEILSYLNQSQIDFDERFIEAQESEFELKHKSINNSVTATEAVQSNSRIQGFCFTRDDTLFAHYTNPRPKTNNLMSDQLKGDGIVEKVVATGLMSDKIQLSIKRALVDLAKQKQISVDSNVEVKRSNQGYFKLTDVRNSGKALIVAELVALSILPGEKEYTIKSSVVEIRP